jgi:peptidoglycan/xylan/chitin deacetylase (PgdA/CDA1 family)
MALTIVMYHYVRRINESRYPEIKGLERDQFIEQISYLKKHYHCVTAKEVIQATRAECELPRNAALLTFDDGYLDHYLNVLPILQKEKLHGCFYPPARCIEDRVILDVNKIHFVLASVPDKSKLVDAINCRIEAARSSYNLDSIESYFHRYRQANRFDPADVIYIKRMLQMGLPEELRGQIVDDLFRQFVSADERAFASEVYMDVDQLRCLVDAGMTVGSHGYNHYWLDRIGPQEQEKEIDLSLDLLKKVGVSMTDWTVCYPYGGWNESLLEVLRRKGCSLGLTTKVDLALPGHDDPLLLPRLDTNDLPKSSNAAPVDWTLKVLATS